MDENRPAKAPKKSKSSTKRAAKNSSTRKRPRTRHRPVDTSPIDESRLSIREFRPADRPHLYKCVKNYHGDFYISIYKRAFRSWFTYALTGALLAASIYFLRSSVYTLCLPPILMTVYLVWRVNKYKRTNWCLTLNELELLNQTESALFKYRSSEARRKHQGVLVALLREESAKQRLKRKCMAQDFALADLHESDLENVSTSTATESSSDVEDVTNETEGTIVAYLVYTRHKDEPETVSIRDLCVEREYRRRGVAKCFVRKAALGVFRHCGYARCTFNVSNFHVEARLACDKKSSYVHKVYSWTAFRFIFGVADERNVYSFNIDQVNKM